MTQADKAAIDRMRAAGSGYKKIADVLGLSVDTVKSYCRRHTVAIPDNLPPSCPLCGSTLQQTRGHRQKRFCSYSCRMTWWKNHPNEIHKNAYYDFNCERCGKHFASYGNNHRKYCSRACAINARKEAAANG